MAHSLWGAPHFIYNEIDAAVISYIEFPSYHAHGWDPAYPPDLAQRLADKNTEMLNFHQALCSDLVICPSQHAKKMFPKPLQVNIEVQMEGFKFDQSGQEKCKPNTSKPISIGFASRDLSSAKGFEIYVRLVSKLIARDTKANFFALGGAGESTYGYEEQWVSRKYGGAVANFRDHLLRKYPSAADVIQFTGKLPYEAFAKQIEEIDIFLYPLQYGVANWGLIEILGRGGCVLAPNRGYAAELIKNDVNGLLLPDDDAAWLDAIADLQADPERRLRYSREARAMARRNYSMHAVAPKYMKLFELSVNNRRARLKDG
jgi:glycosyltransferase involved in cell wall biosynthesis